MEIYSDGQGHKAGWNETRICPYKGKLAGQMYLLI